MDPVVLAAASCLLQIVDTRVETIDGGWREHTLVEAAANPACTWLAWPLPPGVEFVAWSGKARLGDGTKRKLVDERWETTARGLDGWAEVRLHLPDLLSGDRIVVEVERQWPEGGLSWHPGAFRFASLVVDTAQLEVAGLEQDERGAWWTAPATEHTVAHIGGAPAPQRVPAIGAGAWSEERRMTLLVPTVGHPQISLFPGGGSLVQIERFLIFPPGELPRAVVLDIGSDVDVALEVRPRDLARLEQHPDHAVLHVDPSEGQTRAALSWQSPDAPTYGERPAEVQTLTVEAPGGMVEWEGDAWRLVGVHDRPVLPSREGLLRALDNRFRRQALPEPGAPMELRGQPAGWELAELLRPSVLQRSPIGEFPTDPLWPRRLGKARKSGVLSRTEATLVMWLYARQQRLRADWAIARPASSGPGATHSPAGYTAALLRVEHEGEVRWIDPECSVCAPFELPPDLEGADVLSRADTTTPPPTVGRLDVVVSNDGEVTWDLQGPPALALRLWLADVPTHRTEALAERLGGPGASLVILEGLGDAGAPVHLVLRPGQGLWPDPLSLPLPADDDFGWLDWVGTRTVRWPEHPLPEVQATHGPLVYGRKVADDGGIIETLEVSARLIPGEHLRAMAADRWGGASEPHPNPTRP